MIQFKHFLIESVYDKLGGSRGHYRHVEELFVDHGKDGATAAAKLLRETADNKHPLQKKGDGSLAFHIVTNSLGKKGIATKSIDNATPKINYTHEDIEKNHGHSEGLASKLHVLLDNAGNISGNQRHVSGEFLFKPDEVKKEGRGVAFKPNTIKNATEDKEEVEKIKKAKIGVAMHSAFDGDNQRKPLNTGDIKEHEDVYNMNLSAPTVKKSAETEQHLSHLEDTIKKTPPKAFNFISQPHVAEHFKTYINKTVRESTTPNTADFISHVSQHHDKGITKVKTDKAKETKTAEKTNALNELMDNREHLDHAFKVHHATEQAKNHIVNLINGADSKSKVTHHLENADGSYRQTGAEGWTYDSHEHPNINTLKLVNRADFSRNNFNMNARFRKPVTESVWASVLSESLDNYEPKSKHAVLTFGRFSPPHIEHEHLVDAVADHAKDIHGDPHVFVSHSHDNDKNPLTANEKIAVLRKMSPEHKHIFHASSKTSPSIFHALGNLHAKGYEHATVVLGDDRVEEMKNSLHAYNGKFDKNGRGYNFKSINVMTRHDKNNTRDPSGRDGVHASDVRAAARAGDYETVKSQLSPKLSPGMVKSVIKRIQQRSKT